MEKVMNERESNFTQFLKTVSEVRNFTPHDVSIIRGDIRVTYEAEAKPIRVLEDLWELGEYNGVTISSKRLTNVDLPKFEEGVVNIVSLPVAQVVSSTDRVDFVTPGELIRDEEGNIVGCKDLHFIL